MLFRDAEAIENFRRIDTLIVDKTGTLTEGRPAFRQAVGINGFIEEEVLRLAASLDQGSEHPLADAIVRYAKDNGLALQAPEQFESVTGRGTVGVVDGFALAVVVIGNSVWVLDSFLTAFAGWFPVTGLGVFLIVAQAVAVLGFITLQVLGLRRSA